MTVRPPGAGTSSAVSRLRKCRAPRRVTFVTVTGTAGWSGDTEISVSGYLDRHQQIPVLVLALSPNERGLSRIVELENEHVRTECLDPVEEIAGIEGDHDLVPVEVTFELLNSPTALRSEHLQLDTMPTEGQPHWCRDVLAVPDEQSHPSERRCEVLPRHGQVVCVRGRHESVDIRELSTHETGRDAHVAELKDCIEVTVAKRDPVFVALARLTNEALYLGKGASRNENLRAILKSAHSFEVPEREPVRVGGNEPQPLLRRLHLHCGELRRPGVVGQRGADHLPEPLGERRSRKLDPRVLR